MNLEVEFQIKKRRTVKEFFGTLINWQNNTEEIKKDFKKGWK